MHLKKDFLKISPSSLEGKIELPPSKSDTLRALLFAFMARGISKINNPLLSPDTEAMIQAIVSFGGKVEKKEGYFLVEGKGGKIKEESCVIDAGNSGIVLRFMGALASLKKTTTFFTGDHSICFSRVIAPLISGISQLGGDAYGIFDPERAPFLVKGQIQPGRIKIQGEDSQPVSALLIAASFLKGPTVIEVENEGETPWITLTLEWLAQVGAKIKNENFKKYEVEGSLEYSSFEHTVSGDTSAFFYPIACSILSQRKIDIYGIEQKEIGDFPLLYLLEKRGLECVFYPEEKKCSIKLGSFFQGGEIDVNPFIDQLPFLAVLACFGKEKTLLKNGLMARSKESDRIFQMAKNLKKMGANIEEREDGLLIQPSPLRGATLEGALDHRIAMSLIIAALFAKGDSQILGVSCINKSFPLYIEALTKLGAQFS